MGELVLNKFFLTDGIIPASLGYKQVERKGFDDLGPDPANLSAEGINLDDEMDNNDSNNNNTVDDLALQRMLNH